MRRSAAKRLAQWLASALFATIAVVASAEPVTVERDSVLRAEPLDGNLILDINPSILYPIIDRLLGGGKDSGPLARRPLGLGGESPPGVESGAEPERFPEGVEPKDLVALDPSDLQAEAVRSHVDDGQHRGGQSGAWHSGKA